MRFTPMEFTAVFISLASVAISLIGNRTQERLLAASVWPYLSFGTSNASDDGQKEIIDFTVVNSGNGPARIREFKLEYDHQNIVSAKALLERCCDMGRSTTTTSPVVGKVLRPGEEVRLLQLAMSSDIAEGWQRLDKERFSVVLSACFCSTLDECWSIRSDNPEPVAVPMCHVTPREEQWHG